MEQINVTSPGEEFIKDIQQIEHNLSDMRFKIEEGEFKYLPKYRNTLYSLFMKLVGDVKEDNIKELFKQTKNSEIFKTEHNLMTGERHTSKIDQKSYEEYMDKIDQIEIILRQTMKKENYLIKTAEKRRKLT